MADDIRTILAKTADQRIQKAAELKAIETLEDQLITAAWRANVRPSEIALLAKRSTAHVRNLRPDDVPPARLGGGAAPKRRRRQKPAP